MLLVVIQNFFGESARAQKSPAPTLRLNEACKQNADRPRELWKKPERLLPAGIGIKKTCHINWVAHKRRKIFTEFCEPMVWQALLQADVCTLVEDNFLQ